ncbi:guanylate-binding protein 2 [Amia ocellicauda]|uniref:guanylate-binding protein 2 n=1 Tax=Amia ocellicauda TaxID=2972642 RepID=UPI003464CA17
MEEPKLFIEFQDDRLVINEEVTAYLEQLTNKAEVIAIVGKHRTGKSYLLSRFFGSGQGFPVGHSRKLCTKGIWLWARPHPTHYNITLILLDTQGMDDQEGKPINDQKIILLAALLSSFLLYNTMRCIDASAMQDLNVLQQVVREIVVSKSSDGSEEPANYLPNCFCFLIRDYQFQESETMEEYLDEVLQSLKPEMRKSLETSFPHLEIHILPTPVEKNKLRLLPELQLTDLDDDFQKSLSRLISYVHDLCNPKMIGKEKTYCTPGAIVALARSYVSMLNNNESVCLEAAAQDLTQSQLERAFLKAKETFESEAKLENENSPMELHELEERLSDAHDASLNIFKKYSLYLTDTSKIDSKSVELEDLLQTMRNGYLQQNMAQSKQKCHLKIMELKIKHKLLSNTDCKGLDAFSIMKNRIKNFNIEYSKLEDLGPSKQSSYEQLCTEHFGSLLKESYKEMVTFIETQFLEKLKKIEVINNDLLETAALMDKSHKGTTVGNITGSTVGAAGSILTIVGLALIPFTLGTSLIVTGEGAGIGVAGGLTTFFADVGRFFKNKEYKKDLEVKMKVIENDWKELEESIQYYNTVMVELREDDINFPVFQGSLSLLTNVFSLLRLTTLIDDVISLGARAISRVTAVVGGVLSGISLIIDVVSLVTKCKELHEGCKTEAAKKVREQVEEIQIHLCEIRSFIDQIKTHDDANLSVCTP